jgi:chaperonin GroEL (HSP60 family)
LLLTQTINKAWMFATAGVEGEVIIQKVLGKPFSVGYNAMADSIVDLLEEGVIDPAKVTRNGLMNSCSIAGIMLTTQVRGSAVTTRTDKPVGLHVAWSEV